MDLNFQGKTALVTGSTKGIGYATAEMFAREGARVVINGRKQDTIKEALEKLRAAVPGASLSGVAADVSTAEGLATITREVPAVDILVNNAGIFEPKHFTDISRADWVRFFETNVVSGAALTQHYLPIMLKRDWGRVVFVSSESAFNIPLEMVHYGMTKTAQLAVARGAAEMCRSSKVTVNSVLPGPTFSEGVGDFVKAMAEHGGKTVDQAETEFFRDARPSSIAQRFATTGEIANVIVFVASDRAAMINGAAVRTDGGVIKSI